MPRFLSRRLLLGAGLAAPALISARSASAAEEVDVELVLAVDVSRSVDVEEMEMQMRGYAEAFRDPRLADGIAGGPLGAIAVTLFVWSDWNIQNTLVPWMRLDGAATCGQFARALDAASRETSSTPRSPGRSITRAGSSAGATRGCGGWWTSPATG